MAILPRHFLQLFVPVTLLVLAGFFFYGQAEIERDFIRLQAQESLAVGLGAGTLRGHLQDIARDLDFLSNFSDLRQVLDQPDEEGIEVLAQSLKTFSRSKGIYDQIRWIDEEGMERVRVDFREGQAIILPQSELQNKGQRYFFTDSFRLAPGEVFVSPLDLNIEHDAIEIPYKPMVRIATPVQDSAGNKRGILILNFFAQLMLDAFAEATVGIEDHVMVVNGEGYWLKSPWPEEEWGFMFRREDLSLAVRSPQAWQRIRTEDSGQVLLPDGLWTWQTVYPLLAGQRSSTGAAEAFVPSRGELENRDYVWKSLAHLSRSVLEDSQGGVWLKLAPIALVLLSGLGWGAWTLARAWTAREDAEAAVRHLNAELEGRVAARTLELRHKVEELDEANAELGRKNEEMESMIYIASHDLRSPLVNIQGFGQRLNKGVAEIRGRLAGEDVPDTVRASLSRLLEERLPAALGFITSSSLKMDTLITGLLRLSRAGRIQLKLQSLDMDALLASVMENFAIQIHESGASVLIDDSLPACWGDQAQLHQVFCNLLDNALKYRDPDRPLQVRVSGEADHGRVLYRIEDNGIGIAPEQQNKVWELFHRLDPAGPVAGEGLGLTLVRRILQRLRGKISLTSKAGGGSVFTIELPAPRLPA